MGATAIPAERHDGVDRARAEMFAAFVGELNRAEVPYCLLSGYENYPDPNDTDVDFMVGPQDLIERKDHGLSARGKTKKPAADHER